MEDKELQCVDCAGTFTFTAKDQDFYQRNNFSAPKRCRPCRDAKKRRYDEKQSAGGGNFRRERRERRDRDEFGSDNY